MFPDLGEFNFVRKILENGVIPKHEGPKTREWLGAGDDCALFDGWLVTKDLSVEGSHFRLDWSTPEQAVEKHIVSNVSDISAMGGVPKLAVFGICVNRAWSAEVRDRICRAVSEGFARRGIALIGGDTVAGDCGMLSTTLLGQMEDGAPLLRSGARPGDGVYVAGTLGKSAAGLWVLMNRPDARADFARLVDYHLSPEIAESCGAELVRMGVRGACMDISDGLSSELNHLSLSSGVAIEIEEGLLPVDADVRLLSERFGLDPLEFAMNGGEEYEILCTFSDKNDIFLEKAALPQGLTRIGTVKAGTGVSMARRDGSVEIVKAQAWSHL